MLKRIGPLFVLSLLLCVCGCGKSKGTVSGTVKLDNKLVKQGTVILMGADNQPLTTAIQPNGTYTVENVPYGTVRAIVTSPNPKDAQPKNLDLIRKRPGGKELPTPPKVDARDWFPLPEIYGDPTKSGLTFTLDEDVMTYDIRMQGQPANP
jgi:hypothetical protein